MSAAVPQLVPGLVSVTFRGLSVARIIELAREAELSAIEWGGDVHVPPGELATAREVRHRAEEAGLSCSAYGSYYRLGTRGSDFAEVLATAIALGAPVIRVWAGAVGSAAATAEDRAQVTADLIAICRRASDEGKLISLEYHGGTLTDSPQSAFALIEAAAQLNLRSYWQPRHGLSVEENLADLALLRPNLRDVHAFHWWPDGNTRHPFEAGADRWQHYLKAIASDGKARVVSLEFVRGDDEAQLLRDAATLHRLIAAATLPT